MTSVSLFRVLRPLSNIAGKQFEVVDITGLPAHTGFAEIRKTDPLECSSSHNIWHQLEEGAIIRFIDATPALTRLIGRDFVVSVVDSTSSPMASN